MGAQGGHSASRTGPEVEVTSQFHHFSHDHV